MQLRVHHGDRVQKKRYLVDRMLYPGLYILAGAPKVGKSWLAMQLCVSVALGEQFLNGHRSGGVPCSRR